MISSLDSSTAQCYQTSVLDASCKRTLSLYWSSVSKSLTESVQKVNLLQTVGLKVLMMDSDDLVSSDYPDRKKSLLQDNQNS